MPSLSTITASDLMSKPVITARNNDNLSDIVVCLRENKIRHLPIVNDKKQLIGIVSNRDMLVATNTPANVDGERWASHIMTPNPITTTEETQGSDVASLLLKHRIGCLPIMHGERIVGIVTESDFVRFFARSKAQ